MQVCRAQSRTASVKAACQCDRWGLCLGSDNGGAHASRDNRRWACRSLGARRACHGGLTMLSFPSRDAIWRQMRLNQFDYLHASEHAQASLAEWYVVLP
jgi:transposase InsO family protein